ncbi:MAG: DUF1700 domain-containing protein [Oscillospiraceae bacterium]|nr:DUF1700 domain-containing protein [Oscillospiraceae bacterium]
MNKEDFLRELRTALQGLPQEEIEARVSFYSEMIDDRIEEGLSEDEAVAQIGAVENIRAQIIAETPLGKLVREKVRPNRQLRIWEIVLLVLGAPVWIPLLISVAAILFSVYVCIWAVVLCVYAADLALAGGVIAGVAATVMYLMEANFRGALFYAGAAAVCAGLAILLFIGCVRLTKAVAKITRRMLIGIKNAIAGKEE